MTPRRPTREPSARQALATTMKPCSCLLWLLLLLPPLPSSLAAVELTDQRASPGEPFPTSTLVYVSDYFSFVGVDSQGRIAFALDNNRGRDGDTFQAEHFVILHDERLGWVDLAGNGPYENTRKELLRIPDSPSFQFEGTPETGLTITSAQNRLILRVDPIPERHRRTAGNSTIWMGSTPAVLTWQGRTVRGRVIYESLIMPDFNRLIRTYFGLWKEFQGLYLLVDRAGDLYLHTQQSEWLAPLAGQLVGFAVLHEQTETLQDLDVSVLDHEFALGFYRWPAAWRVTWRGAKGPATMTLTVIQRKGIQNWVIGGFSMGIVRGDLTYDSRTWPLYGLAELLM